MVHVSSLSMVNFCIFPPHGHKGNYCPSLLSFLKKHFVFYLFKAQAEGGAQAERENPSGLSAKQGAQHMAQS